jgi:hypothetical protein
VGLPKRDSNYYLRRLEDEHPTILADYKAGKYPSVSAASRAAGLKKPRTRLHEMKNAWEKASIAERKEFLQWAKATSGTPAAPSAPPLVAVNRYLEPWALARVQAIISKRGMAMGDVMDELGRKRLDASLAMALRDGRRLQSDMIVALERWLHSNRNV